MRSKSSAPFLRLWYSILAMLNWARGIPFRLYCAIIRYPYAASIQINQPGGIYFLARSAYFAGDQVVMVGVVRADRRAPAIVEDEWPMREETTRVEPIANVKWWTASGFSRSQAASVMPALALPAQPLRRRHRQLVADRA